MSGLDGLLSGLPPWLQGIGLVAIMGLLAYLGFRRSNKKHRNSKRSTSSAKTTTHSLVDPSEERESPGQHGPDATRDLTAEEIRTLRLSYSPHLDGDPDPGEVIWTWVPYVENDGRGKDRPVLIVSRIDLTTFAGCYLSTKQHRGFISVGTGGWDSQGRESFLSPERLLRVSSEGMRREGQVLSRDRFDLVANALAREHKIAFA